MFSLSGFLRFLLPFSILFIPWRTQLSLKLTSPPPSPIFYILVFSFLPFLRFLWVVVFPLGNNDRAGNNDSPHDASEIELFVTHKLMPLYAQLLRMLAHTAKSFRITKPACSCYLNWIVCAWFLPSTLTAFIMGKCVSTYPFDVQITDTLPVMCYNKKFPTSHQ